MTHHFKRHLIWNLIIWTIFIATCLMLAFFLIYFVLNPHGRWVAPKVFMIIYFLLPLSSILMSLIPIRVIWMFIIYYRYCSNGFKNVSIKIDDHQMSLKSLRGELNIPIDEIEFHNHIFKAGYNSPLFGKGILQIKSTGGADVIIPSILFDYSAGSFVFRDMFKRHSQYFEYQMSWKDFKNSWLNRQSIS